MSPGRWRFRTAGLLAVGVLTIGNPTRALAPDKRLTHYAHRQWTHGAVWIGTQSGVARYRDARVHRFDERAPVANGYVSDFIETKSGDVTDGRPTPTRPARVPFLCARPPAAWRRQ